MVLGACSSTRTAPSLDLDAGAAAQPRAATVERALDRLTTMGRVGSTLRAHQGLAAREDGFHRIGAAPSDALANVVLPRSFDAPVRIEPKRSAEAWLEVRALDAAPVAADTQSDAVMFDAIGTSADAVMVARAGGFEEARLLRGPDAASEFRWSLRVGPGVARVRERSGMIELLDRTGYSLLTANRMFAVDADGRERALEVSLVAEADRYVLTARLDTEGLRYPIAVDPVWSSTANQPGGPYSNIAISLPGSGKVAVLGGYSPYVSLYDPATNTWSGGDLTGSTVPVAPFTWDASSGTDHQWMRAALLKSGDLLVVAGGTATDFGIFHDKTFTWTTFTNKQLAPCADCGLVTLPDGHVLKINGGTSTTTELFDPASNTWSSAAASPITNAGAPVVVALAGPNAGKVFELSNSTTSPAQISSVWTAGSPGSAGSWSSIVNSPFKTNGPTGVALPDGRVFVSGQNFGGTTFTLTGEIFDPSTKSWKNTALSSLPYQNVGYVVLRSGMVLGAGGELPTGSPPTIYSASAIYDPLADVWTSIDSLPAMQAEQAMVVMSNGAVLSVGGVQQYGSPSVEAQIYTPFGLGASCAAPIKAVTCVSGYCVDNTCCSSASCPNGVCNAPAFGSRAAGSCALNNGQSCSADADCASNHCADGVCCNVACTGQCESCALAGTVGTCTPVTGTPVGGRPACTGTGAGTACGPSCDGTTRASCTYAPKDTVACGMAGCTSGVMTTPSKCDGAGNCPDTSSSCGAYACGPSACLTSCTNDAFCATGYYCDTTASPSACVPKLGLGSACSTDAMCASGTYCTDGVCCGVKSCGAGSSCALGSASGPVALGTCSKVAGTACSMNAECGSQHCVDGVCCDTACTDQCAACDVAGKAGTCSPVLGSPHGARTACDDGGSNKCAARRCDGTAKTSACNGYVNDGTVTCAAAQCEGSKLLPASTCDGAGNCQTPTLSSCGKYVCDSTQLVCKTSCAVDADCSSGSICTGGKCTDAPSCSADGTSSINPITGTATSCAPYKCGSNGACPTSCATSADCLSGASCSLTTTPGQCVATASTGASGGCAVASMGSPARPATTLAAFAALSAIAAVATGRRRRSRRSRQTPARPTR
jgi:hypothetical protein